MEAEEILETEMNKVKVVMELMVDKFSFLETLDQGRRDGAILKNLVRFRIMEKYLKKTIPDIENQISKDNKKQLLAAVDEMVKCIQVK
jgi:hypothetical protein